MTHSAIDRFGQKKKYILRKHLAKKTTQSYIFTEFVFSFFNRQQVDCGSSSVQDFSNRKQQNHESLIHSNSLQFVLFF